MLMPYFLPGIIQTRVVETEPHGSQRYRLFQTLQINRQKEIILFNFIQSFPRDQKRAGR